MVAVESCCVGELRFVWRKCDSGKELSLGRRVSSVAQSIGAGVFPNHLDPVRTTVVGSLNWSLKDGV